MDVEDWAGKGFSSLIPEDLVSILFSRPVDCDAFLVSFELLFAEKRIGELL